MLEYHMDGTPPPEFKGKTEVAAGFIFPQIQRSVEFAELGKKGGIKAQQKKALGSTEENEDAQIQNKTETETKQNINTKLEKTETEKIIKQEADENTPAEPSGCSHAQISLSDALLSEKFEKFWRAYPRKQGRAAAYKEFCELDISDDDTLSMLINAVTRQAGSEEWLREQGRFIPNPATWLSDRRWEDEPCVVKRNIYSQDSGEYEGFLTHKPEKDIEIEEWFEAKLKKHFG